MSPRGVHPNSLANLARGGEGGGLDRTTHGFYSLQVQLYGIPARRVCPFREFCSCEGGEKDPCPVLTARAAEKQAELEKRGCSPETAAQAVRLDGQLVQIYAHLAQEGYLKVEEGTVGPQPILKHLGVVENTLARLLRDAGLNRARAGDGETPTPEQLAQMHAEARAAEEAEDV